VSIRRTEIRTTAIHLTNASGNYSFPDLWPATDDEAIFSPQADLTKPPVGVNQRVVLRVDVSLARLVSCKALGARRKSCL
jgi:hypothetical protein